MFVGLMPYIAAGVQRALEYREPLVGEVVGLDAELFGPLGHEDGTSFALVFRSMDAKDRFVANKHRIECGGKKYDPFQDLSRACGQPVVLMIECLPLPSTA